MAATTTCAVLGAEGIGKTWFISKYIYNYSPPKYTPTKHPKSYAYRFNFPPPGVCLNIIESTEVPDSSFSSAILLFDPSQPKSLDFVENLMRSIQEKVPRKIGIILASISKGKTLRKTRNFANKHNASLAFVDMNDRNSVKQCFAFCIQWSKKNLAWESRKQFLYLRESLKKVIHA